MLSLADVSFSYGGRHVLTGVSLDVSSRAVVGVLGANGSGKTTLLRVMAGLRTPAAGTVSLDGTPLSKWARRAIATRLALVPQDTQVAFDYSALDIVLMGRFAHLSGFGLDGPADLAIAERALLATDTLALAHRPFQTLSGGEKQRVVIASALAQLDLVSPAAAAFAPRTLLLDEPTTALDVRRQLELRELLERLNRDLALTIVLSTHDLGFAARVCDTLVCLRDGRVLAAGPARAVLVERVVREVYDVDVSLRVDDELEAVSVVGNRVVSRPRDAR